ncbi:hypothetical protein BLA60_08400 [Actinophytocola xinjiangensis]|uniref:HTH luxR-type domain-containing protein n=1 Tax=Actinophytocola xinjiangensis TaxID=485602 RepID=A0A7Z1AZF8_9PSEU|nr:hypothetical protein [Actinophytocola xinjiangensis]OLF12038.1 hypothetical protein BLA60_08400 [Actinophytocola xinjiangensis]
MLDVLGLDPTGQLVYQSLIRQPGTSVESLATMTRLSPQQIQDSLDSLETLGLASRMPGLLARFTPAPPEVALETLIEQKESELRRARVAAAQISETYRRAASTRHPAELVEIITGREAVEQRAVQLMHGVQTELCGTDRPPHVGDPIRTNQTELVTLARGVTYRVIYDQATVEIPGWWTGHYESVAAAGEQARVMSGVPVKMFVADRRLALVAMQADGDTIEACVIVHPSELLDALCSLFEALWRQAVPISSDNGTPPTVAGHLVPTAFEATLVALLTAGLGDEAISRQTGLSYRTLQRRVRQMMDRLGARTRFQAGLRAAFHGWVQPPDLPD